jgi:integrase
VIRAEIVAIDKEREIPIPTKLATSLKAWKAKANKACGLVFPTAGCNPKLDFFDCLKAVAERAKLNKEGFWLYKSRATFATRCLWAGVDLRTVQPWLGHSDVESTMRYLKLSRRQKVRGKVNEIFSWQDLLMVEHLALLRFEIRSIV